MTFSQRVDNSWFAKNHRLTLLILAGVSVALYALTLFGDFVYDDIPGIVENFNLHNPLPLLFIPTQLSFSLTSIVFHNQPFMYHLGNVLLHAVNVILVYLFLRIFFTSIPSFLGALYFAVHPIGTEAVAWITGRPYLINALFFLVTYLLYHKATTQEKEGGSRLSWGWYIGCLAVFSYYIKHNFSFYFVMPLILALGDVVEGKWRRCWRLWLPFFILVAVSLYFGRATIESRVASTIKEAGVVTGLVNPLPKFVYSLGIHLGLLLFPANLTLYHEPVTSSLLMIIIGLTVVCAVIFAIPWIFRYARPLVLALGMFVVLFAPTYSPLTVTSLIGERYAYFPCVTLAMVVAFFFQRYGLRQAIRRDALVIFAMFLFLFSLRTVVRSLDWHDSGRLWRATAQSSPLSPWAHQHLGFVLQKEGKYDEAIQEYKLALSFKPNLLDAYNNLGTIYGTLGQKDEAIKAYQQILTFDPMFVKAYNNLGSLYNDQGMHVEAIGAYEKSVLLNPDYAYGYYNLGVAYMQLGKPDKAKPYFEKSFTLDPRLAELYRSQASRMSSLSDQSIPQSGNQSLALNEQAVRLSVQGKLSDALPLYQKALALDPQNAQIYNNMGNTYAGLGNLREAIRAFSKAIEIDPKLGIAHYNLSLAYLESKNTLEAIKECDAAQALGYAVPEDFSRALQQYRTSKQK